jgi:hypothetical protein
VADRQVSGWQVSRNYGNIIAKATSLGAAAMAFEELKAQISLLISQINNQPEDAHEIYETLHQKLNELRATGMPLPTDLAEFEQQLQKDFPKP